MPMKKLLNRFLCRWPWLHFQLMRLRRGVADEKRLYLSLVKRGDVVFDVGANIGYFSDLFASTVGSRGKVYSFEPSPETVKQLKASIEGQGQRVEVVNAACGEAEGEVELFQKGEDSGQASLRQQKSASWESSAEVKSFRCRIIRLDGFIRERQLERIDFLKCDVEGAEMLAFRGMGNELGRLKPVVVFELFPSFMRAFGFRPLDLFELLKGQGYDVFYEVGETLRPFSMSDAEALKDGSPPTNILAVNSRVHQMTLSRLRSWGLLES